MSSLINLSISNFTNSNIPNLLKSITRNSGASAYWVIQVISFLLLLLWISKFAEGQFFRLFKSSNVLYKIPGPPGLPFIGNVLEIITSKDIFANIRGYQKIYSPLCRIQFGTKPVIFFNSPNAVEKLLSSNENGHIVKADEYIGLADYWDDGLGISCGEKWRSRRRLLSPLFSYKCFPHFLEVFNNHSKQLVQELDDMFKDKQSAKPIDTILYRSALKIISETTMGVEVNDSSEEFQQFFADAETCKEYIYLRTTRPWYQVKWIWRFLPFRRIYEENMRMVKGYLFKITTQARAKFLHEKEAAQVIRNGHEKVINALLEAGLSDSEIREEAHVVMSAGHETTAATLQFALMFLALAPEHQEKCREEVNEILKDESKCPNGNFTLSALAELKHTEKCLKETLRLYPIAYVFGRKLQSPLKIDNDTVLPAGTTCVVLAPTLHQNEDIYPNPKTFDPSRFTPENCAARHPYAYIPFSAGPRVCLGYKFAMVEMKAILARILHNFKVTTTDKLEDVPMDISIVMVPTRGYNFVLERRNHSDQSLHD